MEPLLTHDPVTIGPYRLLRRIGAGGMGQVYLGVRGSGPPVAVKVVHPGLAFDEEFRKRFEREVAASKRVTGPWVAAVVDADPLAPEPWLASEYVPGPALTDAVDHAGPLPMPTGHVMAGRLARALESIHAAGLVHRDVKPSNVLLGPDGPRLIDFGIARAVDSTRLTGTSVVLGTPAFMSPEQIDGDEVGSPSDVFSLGGVVAHAMSGHGPFGEGNPMVLLRRIVDEEPDLDAVPPPLREPVAACLAKRPGDRPTAAELAVLLDPLPERRDENWLPAPIAALVRDAQAPLDLGDAEAPTVARAHLTTVAGGGTLVSTTRPFVPADLPAPAEPRKVSRRMVLAGLGLAVVGAGAGGIAYTVAAARRPPSTVADVPTSAAAPVAPGPRALWSAEVSGSVPGFVVRGETVYVVVDGSLQALDTGAGTVRWTSTGAGRWTGETGFINHGLAVGDGYALFQTSEGVAAVDAASGALRWGFESSTDPLESSFGGSNLAAGRSAAFVGSGDALRAYDAASGGSRWRHDIAERRGFVAMPVVEGDGVYVTNGDGVSALDAASGTVRWRFGHADTIASISSTGGAVYATDASGLLVALDAATGARVWEAAVGAAGFSPRTDGLLASADDLLLVRGQDRRIHALDAATGAARWSQEHPDVDGATADVGPVVDAGIAYFRSRNGRVYGLDVATGVRRWEYGEPQLPEFAGLAAAGGIVYTNWPRRITAIVAAES